MSTEDVDGTLSESLWMMTTQIQTFHLTASEPFLPAAAAFSWDALGQAVPYCFTGFLRRNLEGKEFVLDML